MNHAMLDVREKIVELIESARYWGSNTSISIHAPRVGSDSRSQPGEALRPISIHAPRVGSDTAQ